MEWSGRKKLELVALQFHFLRVRASFFLSVAACLSRSQELASLHEQKAKLQKHFAYLDIYQREHNEEFTDIHAVLERFMTLKNAHSDLLGEQQRVMSEIEEMRRQVAKAQKAVSMQLINSENLTTRLKAHLDEKRALTAALQSGADEVAVRKGLRILELGQVLQSVYNLHSRCTNSSHGHNLRHSPADGIALGYGRSFRNLRKRMIAAATGGRTPGASTASAASGEGEGEGGSSSAGGTGSSSGADDAGPNGEDSEDDDDSSSSDDEGGHGDDGDDDDDDGARGSPASSPKRKQPAGSPGGAGAEGGEGAAGAGGSPAGSPQRSPGPGKGQGQSSSTPAPVSNKDLAAMDPKVLKKRLRQAVALLNVVGSYIVDLQAIQNEYGAYQAEQRRKAAEREAVLQEEAIKLAAARASKMGGADGKAAQAAVAALEKAVQEKPGTAAGGAARVGATTAAGLAALITSGGGSLPAGVRLGAASAALLPTKSMGGALALGGAVGLSSMGGTGDKTGIAVTGTSNSFLARGSVRVWPRKGQHIPGSVVSKLVAGPAQLEGGK